MKHLRSKTQYILIIEHDEDRMSTLQNILSVGGYRNLICATSQEQVFELIRPFQGRINEIGAILLNFELPQSETLKFSQILTTLDGHDAIPLIFLTNKSTKINDELLAKCHESNAATIVYHPQEGRDLIPLMGLALALKSERDDRIDNEEKLVRELSERRIMEARLQYLVAHDELTGLSNRSGLEKALDFGVLRCNNFKQHGALLDIDLDQFKVVNDIEGHEAGDRLLIEMATLIRSILNVDAFIARVGSNLFQVFIGKTSKDKALALAEKIRLSIDEFDFKSGGNIYNISASIGVAVLEPLEAIKRPSELMSRAHHACYSAKTGGRNRVSLFESDNDELVSLRDDAKWVPVIRKALSKDAFKLVFQPVVQVSDGKVSHYETLLRMIGDSGELLSPAQFIPVAERMGLIHHIDLWVVSHSIDYIASLPKAQEDICFTINLSSHALQGDYLLPVIKQKLESTWISPSRLTFEITETAAVKNFDKTRAMVSKIRALGCRFALDDFGAGFSSFNYIKNFPVDYLKIDGQFIVNLAVDSADQVLVKSMIDVAHSLGKKAIAEYVSNAEILRVLKEFGVDYVQGYLLGKPELELLTEQHISLDNLMRKPLDIEKLITM
ncbi:MAG: diguanylate phosphodiesterase [Cycloclasticus sp. symbiont of Bathymodiolus heckerae]|nr:MAG: diguanylate phosphodiesterase [Cycloclasticus sp. symbiont of Bathymodiolus heckerae]